MAALGAVFFGVVNHFVLQFRGSSLLLADVRSFSTAMSVAGNYGLKMTPVLYTALLAVGCLLLVRSLLDFQNPGESVKEKKKIRLIWAGGGALLLVLLVVASTKTKVDAYTAEKNFPKYGWG